jgi:hypothetical protein
LDLPLNFKLLLIFTFFLSSCGVKAPPQADSSYNIPSVVEQYKSKLISNIDEEAKDKSNSKKK